MKRRSLLGKLAAVAAAVAVAPAVTAEAAPIEVLPTLMPGQRWTIEQPERECCNGVCGGQGVGEADGPPEPYTIQAVPGKIRISHDSTLTVHGATTFVPRDGCVGFYGTKPIPVPIKATDDPPVDLRSYDAGYAQARRDRPHITEPLTFEAMQADCAARGCSLERSILSDAEGRWANFYHRPLPDSWQDNPDDTDHLVRVEVWRRSLHEARG